MDIRYYYRTHADGNIIKGEVGHIRAVPNESDVFFCGIERPERFNISEWAKPGQKLCLVCVRERDRLIDGRPTSEQLQTWWDGGMVAHKREMEKLTG